MRTLAERLAWAREQRGLTQEALAKLAGVSQSTIGNLESGLRSNPRRIINIADALGVDPAWLAEGRGAPFASNGTAAIEDDATIIEHRIAQARADAIAAGSGEFKPVLLAGDDSDDVEIPMVELRLSAGVSGFQVAQDSESPIGHIKIDRSFVASNKYDPSRLVAIRVRGESMEPKLSHGDTVIINTADVTPVDGAVFAVNYEGEAVIKRLSRDAGDWWLTSDNPDQRRFHRKICRGGDCIIVGRAVRAVTDNL
jgi:phage repressor protein C with HTH and peptisase S24 domain